MIGCDSGSGYFLTGLYVEIDDHVIPSSRCGPGQPKRLSDSELVGPAVAQVLLGAKSEHSLAADVLRLVRDLFPYLPG